MIFKGHILSQVWCLLHFNTCWARVEPALDAGPTSLSRPTTTARIHWASSAAPGSSSDSTVALQLTSEGGPLVGAHGPHNGVTSVGCIFYGRRLIG